MGKMLRVRKIGSGLGLSLPKELGFEEGEELYAISTAEGLHLTRLDPDFDQAMAAAGDFIRRYPNMIKKLAE